MKSNKIIITLTIALVTNFLACAGEYPIVKNNFGPIDFQGQPVIDENGNQIYSDSPEETQMRTYLLIRNQLVELTYDRACPKGGYFSKLAVHRCGSGFLSPMEGIVGDQDQFLAGVMP